MIPTSRGCSYVRSTLDATAIFWILVIYVTVRAVFFPVAACRWSGFPCGLLVLLLSLTLHLRLPWVVFRCWIAIVVRGWPLALHRCSKISGYSTNLDIFLLQGSVLYTAMISGHKSGMGLTDVLWSPSPSRVELLGPGKKRRKQFISWRCLKNQIPVVDNSPVSR